MCMFALILSGASILTELFYVMETIRPDKKSNRHRSDAKVLDRCLIQIDPTVFAVRVSFMVHLFLIPVERLSPWVFSIAVTDPQTQGVMTRLNNIVRCKYLYVFKLWSFSQSLYLLVNLHMQSPNSLVSITRRNNPSNNLKTLGFSKTLHDILIRTEEDTSLHTDSSIWANMQK